MALLIKDYKYGKYSTLVDRLGLTISGESVDLLRKFCADTQRISLSHTASLIIAKAIKRGVEI